MNERSLVGYKNLHDVASGLALTLFWGYFLTAVEFLSSFGRRGSHEHHAASVCGRLCLLVAAGSALDGVVTW